MLSFELEFTFTAQEVQEDDSLFDVEMAKSADVLILFRLGKPVFGELSVREYQTKLTSDNKSVAERNHCPPHQLAQ